MLLAVNVEVVNNVQGVRSLEEELEKKGERELPALTFDNAIGRLGYVHVWVFFFVYSLWKQPHD